MTYIQPTGGGTVVNTRNYLAGLSFVGGIEAPSTLPELVHTWGDSHVSANPWGLEAWIDTIEAAVLGTENGWRVLDELNQLGGLQRSLLVGGPLGSPVEDLRVLFTVGSTRPTNRCWDTAGSNYYQYVGMAPDAGSGYDAFSANGGTVGDPWDGGGANPFGVARFTGHAIFGREVNGAAYGQGQVCIADSLETLFVTTVRAPSNDKVGAIYLGATIMPPNDAAAEANGRVYGLHTSGYNGLNNAMNAAYSRFPGYQPSSGISPMSVIYDPSSPSTILPLVRYIMNGGPATAHTTVTGPSYGSSIPMNDYTGYEGRGWMRQLAAISDSTLGTTISDVNNVPTAFAAASDPRYYYDAVAVVNKPHSSPTGLYGLPKLTFSVGAAQNLPVTTDMEDWIDAIDAAVTATTNGWRVLDRLTQAGAPAGTNIALLIGGPLGSPVENARAIFTGSAGGSDEPLGLFYQSYGAANYGYVGYSPDAGAFGNYLVFGAGAGEVKDPWTSATPFDDARWSGLAATARDIGTKSLTYVQAIDSAETLLIATNNATDTNRLRISYFGAAMVPVSPWGADPDGRLHSIHVSNPQTMTSGANNRERWPAHSASTLESCAAVFTPSPVLRYPQKWYPYVATATTGTTPDGSKYAAGVVMYDINVAGLGWMRQLGNISDALCFSPITDKGAATVGYAVSRSAILAANSYALLNFTNAP